MQLFFRGAKVKECGGEHSDREDTKTCELVVEKVSKSNSCQYGCIVSNVMACSTAELILNLRGENQPINNLSSP